MSISDRPKLSKTTFSVLRQYCIKHGYDLEIRHQSLDRSRHISWSKIVLLMEMLERQEHDYYVWIDDDVLITDMNVPFESFIDRYEFSKCSADIMISRDVIGERECPFNCGLMFFKPTLSAIELLKNIWSLCETLQNQFRANWEQDAFIHYYHSVDASPFCIVPHKILQSFYRDYQLPAELKWSPGDFAAHITGMPIEKRMKALDDIMRII
jgi:hypothetical protein